MQTDGKYKIVQEIIFTSFMSNQSSSYQIQHTHFCNNVVPATSPASKLRPPAADHPSAPRPRTCPGLQPTMDCLRQSSERSGPWTRRGRPIKYLPTFCRSLYEYIQVDANFFTRRAKASRSECPCASRSKRNAVWCFPSH